MYPSPSVDELLRYLIARRDSPVSEYIINSTPVKLVGILRLVPEMMVDLRVHLPEVLLEEAELFREFHEGSWLIFISGLRMCLSITPIFVDNSGAQTVGHQLPSAPPLVKIEREEPGLGFITLNLGKV